MMFSKLHVTADGRRRTRRARRGFTLMELLIVMAIMIVITTILVGGYFGMTRAASYHAAETGVFNLLQLARQRACMDGTKVFFMLLDSNTCVLVRGVGELGTGMQKSSEGELRYHFYDYYADHHIITNEFSKLRVWNMSNNLYGEDVQLSRSFNAGSRADFRPFYTVDAKLRSAGEVNQWKKGDRYGFELFPRHVLPLGFLFSVNTIGNLPENFRIAFNADGSSSWFDATGNEHTSGMIKLYISERSLKKQDQQEKASAIIIACPAATIKIEKR